MTRCRFEIDSTFPDDERTFPVFDDPADVTEWLRGADEPTDYHVTALLSDPSVEDGWCLIDSTNGEEWLAAVEQREVTG